MNIPKEELVARFRELADEELVRRVEGGTLTELARQVAEEEMRTRGLVLTTDDLDDADKDVMDELAAGMEVEEVELVTIAKFDNPVEANVLRACLDANGVFAHVWGEHLGVANVFLSTGSGGVRVQVRSDQVDEARELMAAIERGDLDLGKL